MSDDRDERPRLSWSEIDKRRSGARPRSDEPRGHGARQEQVRRSEHALEAADALFSLGQGGADGAELASRMRDAQGSPEFLQACREYREKIGIPNDRALPSLWLDTGDRALVVDALEALLAEKNEGSLELSAGTRSQLRVLAQDADDTVAGISEDLLED